MADEVSPELVPFYPVQYVLCRNATRHDLTSARNSAGLRPDSVSHNPDIVNGIMSIGIGEAFHKAVPLNKRFYISAKGVYRSSPKALP
jgi:hypothetical protein